MRKGKYAYVAISAVDFTVPVSLVTALIDWAATPFARGPLVEGARSALEFFEDQWPKVVSYRLWSGIFWFFQHIAIIVIMSVSCPSWFADKDWLFHSIFHRASSGIVGRATLPAIMLPHEVVLGIFYRTAMDIVLILDSDALLCFFSSSHFDLGKSE